MEQLTRRSVLAAGAAAPWAWLRRGDDAVPAIGAAFIGPPRAIPAAEPFFASGFLDHVPPVPYVHCPSICELADGGLACAWYAGSAEATRDVAVWLATAPAVSTAAEGRAAWSQPRAVVDRARAAADLDRFVDKVGNGVVFRAPDDRVWLVFVSIAVGGWSGSTLNACSSADGGATWSAVRRLVLSPFLNVSELVRAAPVMLDSGEIALPIYHECAGKFPEMLWLRPVGDRLIARKTRLAGGRSLLQPAVVPLDAERGLAFLRDHSARRRLVVQATDDAGRTWSPPSPTPLPNPDASVAALALSDGTVLLACNRARSLRESLDLVLFDPTAKAWHAIATLDRETGARFAYPYLIRDRRGVVHLVYTWKMARIRHVAMNEAWIRSQPREPVA